MGGPANVVEQESTPSCWLGGMSKLESGWYFQPGGLHSVLRIVSQSVVFSEADTSVAESLKGSALVLTGRPSLPSARLCSALTGRGFDHTPGPSAEFPQNLPLPGRWIDQSWAEPFSSRFRSCSL